MNVPALIANTVAGDPTASRAAPRAGPVMTTRLSIPPFSALADTSSSASAISGNIAATAGL